MTKEEILEYFKDINGAYNECTRYDSLKRMLEELEQEPCEDAISRKPFTDATICEGISCNECAFCRKDKRVCILEERVMKLPSIQPKPKTGHWVIERAVDCYLEKAECHCSNCLNKRVFPASYNHITQKMYFTDADREWVFNYCPNCGADMRGASDE